MIPPAETTQDQQYDTNVTAHMYFYCMKLIRLVYFHCMKLIILTK